MGESVPRGYGLLEFDFVKVGHITKRTMITVTVWVNARAGKTRRATATVSPSDNTPADNTSTDKAIIRKH